MNVPATWTLERRGTTAFLLKNRETKESMKSPDTDSNAPERDPPQTRVDAAHLPLAQADDAAAQGTEIRQAELQTAAVSAGEGTRQEGAADEEMLRLLAPRDFRGDHAEQLRRHATELAERLQQRHAELDHRESQLNARAAALESQTRTTRLWLDEQRRLLAARRETLAPGDSLSEELGGATGKDTASGDLEPRVEADWLEAESTSLFDADTELESLEALAVKVGVIGENGETVLEEGVAEEALSARQRYEARVRQLDLRQAQLQREIEELTDRRTEILGQQDELDAIRKELESTRGELIKRRKELEKQSSEFGEKSEQLESLRSDLDRRVVEQETRCEEIEQRERQLEARMREIDTALRRFERLGVTERRMRELEEEIAATDARSRYLDQAEKLLADQQSELAQGQRGLRQEKSQFEEERNRWRKTTTEQRSREQAEVNGRRQALDRRAADLDRREAALEHVRVELAASQREALELRLATEEVWGQLSGALAPASLSRSIAQTRAQLADQYRQEAVDLSDRKETLEAMSRKLVEQAHKLAEQREELHLWARRRQEEIEQQAKRIVHRERELDRQLSSFEELQANWLQERAGYQRQIQELLSVTRKVDGNCAAA